MDWIMIFKKYIPEKPWLKPKSTGQLYKILEDRGYVQEHTLDMTDKARVFTYQGRDQRTSPIKTVKRLVEQSDLAKILHVWEGDRGRIFVSTN